MLGQRGTPVAQLHAACRPGRMHRQIDLQLVLRGLSSSKAPSTKPPRSPLRPRRRPPPLAGTSGSGLSISSRTAPSQRRWTRSRPVRRTAPRQAGVARPPRSRPGAGLPALMRAAASWHRARNSATAALSRASAVQPRAASAACSISLSGGSTAAAARKPARRCPGRVHCN